MRHPYRIERQYYLMLIAMLRSIRQKSHLIIYPPAKDVTGGETAQIINLQEAILLIDALAQKEAKEASIKAFFFGMETVVWSMNAFRGSVGFKGRVVPIDLLYNRPFDKKVSSYRPVSSTPIAGLQKSLPKEKPLELPKISLFARITEPASFAVDIFADNPKLYEQMYAYAQQSTALIDSLSQEQVDKISGSIMRGVQAGTPWRDTAEEIRKGAGICDRRAKNIARDQTAKLNGAITRELQTSIGITHYIWRTVMDERVRPTHRANEGKKFSWSDPPSNTGHNHPAGDVMCRCIAEPVLEKPFLKDNN
jgi:SPP1 gp7 family putative phage head morphogenesis protein